MKAVFREEISDVVDASFSADAHGNCCHSSNVGSRCIFCGGSSQKKDDSEDNMNAGPGDKKTDGEEEAALDVTEGNIQKKG